MFDGSVYRPKRSSLFDNHPFSQDTGYTLFVPTLAKGPAHIYYIHVLHRGGKFIVVILLSWLFLLGTIRTLRHLSFGTNACDLSTLDYALASTLKGDFMADPFHQFAFGQWRRENGRLGFIPGRVRGWQSHFAIHFSPILILLLPLYAAIPSPLLLIYLELVAIAISAYFLYKIAENTIHDRPYVHGAIVIIYLVFRQLMIATMHDFHFELFFPALFLGAHYYLTVKKNYRLGLLFIGLALLVKEDIAIYLFFYGLFLVVRLKERKYGTMIAGLSFAYALLAFGWAMPFFRSLSGGGGRILTFSARSMASSRR